MTQIGEVTQIKFEQIDMKFPSNCVLFGPTMSGKSFLIERFVAKYQYKFKHIFAFGANVDNFKWLDQKKAQLEIDLLYINRIMTANRDKKESTLIILDDVMQFDFTNGKNGKIWRDIISRCRHSNISFILSIQHIKALSPAMRGNCQYLFCTDLNNRTAEDIHKLTNIDSLSELKMMGKKIKGYKSFLAIRWPTNKDHLIVV